MWFLGFEIGFDQGFWVLVRFCKAGAAAIGLIKVGVSQNPYLWVYVILGFMKIDVEIRNPLMVEAEAVCVKHNISMTTLMNRALATEVEKLAAQPVWQPTDEFIIHGDVTVRSDVNADIAQMYEDIMNYHESLGKDTE